MAKLRVTQVRSSVSRRGDQGRTLRALGIRRMWDSVEVDDRPDIAGMIRKVAHLVRVESVDGQGAGGEA
ncbi:MAG: 50S ribosomal protein L30 [Actinomycetota bacterium]